MLADICSSMQIVLKRAQDQGADRGGMCVLEEHYSRFAASTKATQKCISQDLAKLAEALTARSSLKRSELQTRYLKTLLVSTDWARCRLQVEENRSTTYYSFAVPWTSGALGNLIVELNVECQKCEHALIMEVDSRKGVDNTHALLKAFRFEAAEISESLAAEVAHAVGLSVGEVREQYRRLYIENNMVLSAKNREVHLARRLLPQLESCSWKNQCESDQVTAGEAELNDFVREHCGTSSLLGPGIASSTSSSSSSSSRDAADTVENTETVGNAFSVAAAVAAAGRPVTFQGLRDGKMPFRKLCAEVDSAEKPVDLRTGASLAHMYVAFATGVNNSCGVEGTFSELMRDVGPSVGPAARAEICYRAQALRILEENDLLGTVLSASEQAYARISAGQEAITVSYNATSSKLGRFGRKTKKYFGRSAQRKTNDGYLSEADRAAVARDLGDLQKRAGHLHEEVAKTPFICLDHARTQRIDCLLSFLEKNRATMSAAQCQDVTHRIDYILSLHPFDEDYDDAVLDFAVPSSVAVERSPDGAPESKVRKTSKKG